MGKQETREKLQGKKRRKAKGQHASCFPFYFLLFAFYFFFGCSPGCVWDNWQLFGSKTPLPPGPADSLVLRGDHLESDVPANAGPAAKELGGAEELVRRGAYAEAEKTFHRIAENTKNTPTIAEEARYYEGECLRCQGNYPKAVAVYHRQLMDFSSGAHREQALKHMFDIANYWLDDTREQMRLEREQREGKRWFVMPASFVHFEKSKPLFDEEGRAVDALEQVEVNDISNPLAAEALFLEGSVKFYHQDYREADRLFSQLVEFHPNSKWAAKSVELAIIAKHMSTGGPDYDGRKTAEARLMVYTARDKYPELASKKSDFLSRQLAGITKQQAEKDMQTADFYRRTGHPGAAYFCYDIVRLRYPGTPFFDQATKRMHELEAKAKKTKGKVVVPSVPAPRPAAAPAPRPGQPDRLPAQPDKLPKVPDLAPVPEPAATAIR